MDKDTF